MIIMLKFISRKRRFFFFIWASLNTHAVMSKNCNVWKICCSNKSYVFNNIAENHGTLYNRCSLSKENAAPPYVRYLRCLHLKIRTLRSLMVMEKNVKWQNWNKALRNEQSCNWATINLEQCKCWEVMTRTTTIAPKIR